VARGSLTAISGATDTHTVVTANIRVPLSADTDSGNGWLDRRDLCAEVLRSRRPDVICLQEVIRRPLEDLLERLPGFDCHGFVGPEMDARPDEYQLIAKNPILYARSRYSVVTAGGFWLSETPHLPASLSWGSARARHVNWVRLSDRHNGTELRILNTHLDHASQPAREQQMRMILDECATYAPSFPQLLVGDLNADATNPAYAHAIERGWTDTYEAVHGAGEGREFTAHAFKGPAHVARSGRIDFILARGTVSTEGAEIIRDAPQGRFPSDHYFVSARIRLH
jgi:endonuclease/exonuclease/phosphatase family metal-dependent hydrolase